MRPPAALLALSLALCACRSSPSSGSTTDPGPQWLPYTGSTSHAAPLFKAPKAPAPLAKPATAEELAAMAKSDNAFGLELFGKVKKQKGNLAFSPFSIATALAMTWAGAQGETQAQMGKVLHLDAQPVDRTLDVAGALVASYGAPDQKVTIRVANRLFGEKSYPFEKPYLATIERAFGAPLEKLDFKGAAEDGRRRINTWVEEETNDRIKELVPFSGVNEMTRLALVNAVYFLGDWAGPFSKAATSPAPFFISKDDKKDVPTMHQEEHLRFAATGGVKLLELPYRDPAFSMVFVLPDAVDGLPAVEERLDAAVLERWMGAMATARVDVSLPKLEIAPAQPLSLADTLSGMGMALAFDRDKADLGGIARPKDPAERLFIAKVFHKAFVKIDEKGTEAAAATAVMAEAAGAAPPVEPPKEFKADHPFLFFLRDTRSGLVLFMGRAADPSAK
jgi:serpin B